jgi:hypothetical protein
MHQLMEPGDARVAFLKAFDQLDAAHGGHQRIDQDASATAWATSLEEGRAIGEKLHRMPVFLKQIAHRLADGAVIVDDEYRGRRVTFQTKGQLLDSVWRARARLGKETLG